MTPNVFICYVHNNIRAVRKLVEELRQAGINVWWDQDPGLIQAGRRWEDEIERLIDKCDFFFACFSREFETKNRTQMRRELHFACELLQKMDRARNWFIPIRINKCYIPAIPIGAHETLRNLEWKDLFNKRASTLKHLISIIISNGSVHYEVKPEKEAKSIPHKQKRARRMLSLAYDPELSTNSGIHFLRFGLHSIVQSYQSMTWDKKLTLLILDIDDLTKINKTFGKDMGDTILITVATILRDVPVDEHHSGRCGEDTFFNLLLGKNIDEAKLISKTILRKIKKYPWPLFGHGLRVTACIGIAELRGDEDARDLAARASIGLNYAKSSGAGQVSLGPALLAKNQSRNPNSYFS